MSELVDDTDLKSVESNLVRVRVSPRAHNSMGAKYTKSINSDFFKKRSSEMYYVLGYIVADGCVVKSKDRPKNPYTLNITSAEKEHLYNIRQALNSEHKISKKIGGYSVKPIYQLQIRNKVLTYDLMKRGIMPKKTYNIKPIEIPNKYFHDYFRGFFDGDGTVYIYEVNGVVQVKAGFVGTSLPFIVDLNRKLCSNLGIATKNVHKVFDKRKGRERNRYSVDFYINDCERLARFMYGHKPSLYLERKFRIFEEWKSMRRRKYVKHNYPSKVGWRLNQYPIVR